MTTTKHRQLEKELTRCIAEDNSTIDDIRRGILATKTFHFVYVEPAVTGYYIVINIPETNKLGYFAINAPLHDVTLSDDNHAFWKKLLEILQRILDQACQSKRALWNITLANNDLYSLTIEQLKLSTLLLPVSSNGEPVEDIRTATHLYHFAFMIAPETSVKAPINDIQKLACKRYGLWVVDNNATLRGRGSVFYNLVGSVRVHDFATQCRLTTLPKEEIEYYLDNLVLIDIIARPTVKV